MKKNNSSSKLTSLTMNSNNNIWIIHDFFSQKEFNLIKKYCLKLNLKDDHRNNDRLSLCLGLSPRPIKHGSNKRPQFR